MQNMKPWHKITILWVLSLVVCIAYARRLIWAPSFDRGLEGHYLQTLISPSAFHRTAIVTATAVFLVSLFLLRFMVALSLYLAAAFTTMNVGIMVVDARLNNWTESIDKSIAHVFFDKPTTYLIGVGAICLSALLLAIPYWKKRCLFEKKAF